MKIYQDIAEFIGLEKPPTVKITTLKGKRNPAGWYMPGHDKVVVNMQEIRTFRDLIYTLAHEFTHAKQTVEIGVTKLLSYYEDYEYDDNPLEVEADKLAFAFEDTMKYKNRVLNPNTSSIWLIRKILRNGS